MWSDSQQAFWWIKKSTHFPWSIHTILQDVLWFSACHFTDQEINIFLGPFTPSSKACYFCLTPFPILTGVTSLGGSMMLLNCWLTLIGLGLLTWVGALTSQQIFCTNSYIVFDSLAVEWSDLIPFGEKKRSWLDLANARQFFSAGGRKRRDAVRRIWKKPITKKIKTKKLVIMNMKQRRHCCYCVFLFIHHILFTLIVAIFIVCCHFQKRGKDIEKK